MIPLWRCVSPDSVLGWFASPNSMKRVLTWRHFLFMFFRSPRLFLPAAFEAYPTIRWQFTLSAHPRRGNLSGW